MSLVEIPLANTIRKAIVDNIDADVLLRNWYVSKHQTGKWKITTSDSGRTTYLGRIILSRIIGRPLAPFEYVGYWYGNPFDNRRVNLFVATIHQINHRRRTFDNNEVKYKGVTYMKRDNRYRARIYVNGNAIYLGQYEYAEHAYAAYCRAAIKYYGEFAILE